ncbi:DUF559 domain-containing protein [Bacillus cereus]|uniref:DUF559 domain-containing protein n=1 Tax=Bacillus TaxID=1386 RepID=UPI00077ADAFC|nr:DUF559 domain-containing protein [Bacillus thuringiensis]KXY54388.1 hypothetical protein AT261_23315 [Bacillus cereus]PFP53118.1 DUF559 domain-containing protein [Bacillus cereus]PFQ64120.1 DUF559 domain-containing protein [Bacillus cereus]PGK33352.1 DUF559 domain-containing protein [Bacillus thuringiensis]
MFVIAITLLAAYGLFFAMKNLKFEKINKPSHDSRSIGIEHNRKKCSNRFELDMFNTLVQMGYYPLCQIKEKRYKLDFVLIENGKKVAIEADGDIFHDKKRDTKRDHYLKQIGYKSVIRIKYSAWKEDKMKCISRLEMRLYELELLPSSHPSFELQFQTAPIPKS